MRAAQIILTLALLAMAHHARSACTPFRLGFVNQHRPPYFLGNGSTEARPPGASVDLIRDISAAAGCAIMAVRLPPLRLRNALVSRDIDATLMNVAETDAGEFALPLDKNGKLDPARAVTMYTVVFVRAADNIPLDADPRAYFMSHRLGTNNGASLAAQLRGEGFHIDDGAHDGERNLEKLARGRIDGYAATVVSPMNMDASVAAKFGSKLVRLKTPLRIHHFWLGFTKSYYARNRDAVETMWAWMGEHADLRFAWHVEQYAKVPLQPPGEKSK
jgi:polar amino acid transport system substrate-binding protein